MEFVVRDAVPVVARVLGIPEHLAELAVRHTMSCTERPCMVEGYLTRRLVANAAEEMGVSPQQLMDLAEAVAKGANDSARLQNDIAPVGVADLQAVYENGKGAMAAGLQILQEQHDGR